MPAPSGTEPTVAASPVALARRSEVSTTAAQLTSGLQVRTRGLVALVVLSSIALLGSTVALGGTRVGQGAFLAGVLVFLAIVPVIAWMTASPGRVTTRLASAVSVVIAATTTCCVAYYGVFSGAALIHLIAIGFVTFLNDWRVGLVHTVAAALLQGALAAAIISGALDDPGLVTAGGLDTTQQVLLQLTFLVVLAVGYVYGMVSRRATDVTVGELERAIREVARREAVIEEARAELERALRGAIGPGRFTGQVLGSFRLGDVIGRGGMGEVYDAARVDSGEPAAVKLLRREALDDRDVLVRFAREARVVQSLTGAHLVRVLEVGGETAPLPYIAMERLRGVDLAQILRERLRLPGDEVIAMLREVAAGVDVAHRAGVVHRDLKPANLFRHDDDGRPVWKVLDFGVSRLDTDDTLTAAQMVVGTPAYMAPEQATGGTVGARADLYALGVIAFRALTGQLPHLGGDPQAVLASIARDPPRRAAELAPDLPPAVSVVLARALARDPADRYPSAGALVDALAAAL